MPCEQTTPNVRESREGSLGMCLNYFKPLTKKTILKQREKDVM